MTDFFLAQILQHGSDPLKLHLTTLCTSPSYKSCPGHHPVAFLHNRESFSFRGFRFAAVIAEWKAKALHFKGPRQLLQLLPLQRFCDMLQDTDVTEAANKRLAEAMQIAGVLPLRVLPAELQIGFLVSGEGWRVFQRVQVMDGPWYSGDTWGLECFQQEIYFKREREGHVINYLT